MVVQLLWINLQRRRAIAAVAIAGSELTAVNVIGSASLKTVFKSFHNHCR
jgi:hypothetical protein